MTIRVLIGTAYFESHRGGIEIVAGMLARELQRQRGSGYLVCGRCLAAARDRIPAAAHHCPSAPGTSRSAGSGCRCPCRDPGVSRPSGASVRAADTVLLHDSLYPTNVVAMLAARWHRKPVVLAQHIAAVPYSNPLLRGIMGAANALIARPMLATADQVVFISAAVAGHFAQVPFKAAPRLIFNGVDTDVFRLPPAGFDKGRARASLGLPIDRRVVLFVGRFVEKKGLHLIERLARCRSDLTFALAGWGPIDPSDLAAAQRPRALQPAGPISRPSLSVERCFRSAIDRRGIATCAAGGARVRPAGDLRHRRPLLRIRAPARSSRAW